MKKAFAVIGISLVLMISVLPLFASAEIVPDEWVSVSSFRFSSMSDLSWFAGGSASERPFFSLTPYTADGFRMTIDIDGTTRFNLTNNDPDGRYTYGVLGVVYSAGSYYIQLYQSSTKSFRMSYPITDQSVISISVTYPSDYDTLSHLSSLSRLTVVDGVPVPHPSPADRVTEVFTAVGDWIVTSLESLSEAFWLDGSLTLLGTLAVCGLAFAFCLLLIALIRNWFNFGG